VIRRHTWAELIYRRRACLTYSMDTERPAGVVTKPVMISFISLWQAAALFSALSLHQLFTPVDLLNKLQAYQEAIRQRK